MKEIRMKFSEYEDMVELIKRQELAINEFIEADNVVVVDVRGKSSYKGFDLNMVIGGVPKIIGDPELAKELLQAEFNRLSSKLEDYQKDIMDRIYKEEADCKKQKRWWE